MLSSLGMVSRWSSMSMYRVWTEGFRTSSSLEARFFDDTATVVVFPIWLQRAGCALRRVCGYLCHDVVPRQRQA